MTIKATRPGSGATHPNTHGYGLMPAAYGVEVKTFTEEQAEDWSRVETDQSGGVQVR